MSNVNNKLALIHFQLDAQTHLESLGLKYQDTGEELDVIVDDVDQIVKSNNLLTIITLGYKF